MNITLQPCSKEELHDLIKFSYQGDEDLISNYQAANRTFEECVDFNYNELINLAAKKDEPGEVFFWKIDMEGTIIGYCATIENEDKPHMLASCAIRKPYRWKEVLVDWLAAVEERLGTPYYIGLWNKNSRAINFFQKNGFTPVVSAEDPSYTYMVKGIELLNPEKLMNPWCQEQ